MAVLPPAAFAVHQLRYLLAYGSGAGAELHQTGHSYLHSVVPWLVMGVALSAGCFLRSVGHAMAGQTSARRFTVSFAGLWLTCSLALVALFVCQESLEGLFATGHPGGLAGVFGFGGWWAVPAAGGVGLALAALFHGARWVVQEISRRHAVAGEAWPGSPVLMARPHDAVVLAPAPLLGGWSSRGPPRPA